MARTTEKKAVPAEATTPLPSLLHTPPSKLTKPPVKTRTQELPFAELSWENFEKLCVRIAKLEGIPEECRRYGVVGQGQEGIDLYARERSGERFLSYQCKRYKALTPADLKSSVQRFLAGSWKSRSSHFVFCVSVGLEPTELDEEVRRQRERLRAEGFEFRALGSVELSALLKAHADIVDDFFGREWVKEFCGDDAAARLGARHDGPALDHLRQQLRQFYRGIFPIHDPGVPFRRGRAGAVPDLLSRYIQPRVSVSQRWTHDDDETLVPDSQSESPWDPPPIPDGPWDPPPPIPDGPSSPEFIQRDQSLEDWLLSSERLLITGTPGAGKSSLLRFVALDLLSESPQMSRFAQARQGFIPIWVPFGFWTDRFGEHDVADCSLRSCLQAWLSSHDHADLYPVVEAALRDGRLLLLVDGIDEWRTRDSAGFAMQRLIEFSDRHGPSLLCSSRPYGLDRAMEVHQSIEEGELLGLNATDQRALATIWYTHWLASESTEPGVLASSRAVEFTSALSMRADLNELAENPMLLVVLAQLWLHKRELPADRFSASRQLVEHLHSGHPKARANAASAKQTKLVSGDEGLEWLAFVAFSMQEAGVLVAPREELREKLIARLRVDGFDRAQSGERADAVLGQSSDGPALVVNTSRENIAFLHRTFLEHLAARWILKKCIEEQLAIVTKHVVDPLWSEVLLGVLEGGPADLPSLLRSIEAAAECHPESPAPRLLLARVAFGTSKLDARVACSLAAKALAYVDQGSSSEVRQTIVKLAVGGLRSDRADTQVRKQLKRWFPSGASYRAHVFSAMDGLAQSSELRSALFRALNDDDPAAQRAAAKSLGSVFAKDEATSAQLVFMMSQPNRPSTLAAALYALWTGWPGSPALEDLAKSALTSASPLVRVVAHLIRTSRGCHAADDARDLINMIAQRGTLLDHGWRDLARQLLIAHWSDSPLLLQFARERLEWVLPSDDDWLLAAAVLPSDDWLARMVIAALENVRQGNHTEAFWVVASKFRDTRSVILAVEGWASRRMWFDLSLHAAVCAFPTRRTRQIALEAAFEQGYPQSLPFRALVEAWSLNDPEIRSLALQFVADPRGAPYCARYLSELVGVEVGREHVLRLLGDPTCARPDLVMLAVLQAPKDYDLMEIATVYFSAATKSDPHYRSVVSQLLTLGVEHPRLVQLATEAGARANDLLASALKGFGRHPVIGPQLIEAAVPGAVLVRRAMVEELVRVPRNVGVGDILSDWQAEDDGVSRALAVTTYSERYGRADALLIGRLLDAATTSFGVHFQDRRQGALCGLLKLECLEKLDERREEFGEHRVRIPFAAGYQVNPVAVRTLAEKWTYVSGVWGDQVRERLEGLNDAVRDELAFLSEIADWVPVSSPLGVHMLDRIRAGSAEARYKFLGFVSRALPRSPLLLEQCLRILAVRGASGSPDISEQARAADILATQFANVEVRDEIIRAVGDAFPPPAVLIAMCRGWPNDEWIARTYHRALKEDVQPGELGEVELICAGGATDEVIKVVSYLADPTQYLGTLRRLMLSAVFRRARRDAEVPKYMLELMGDRSGGLAQQMAGARLFAACRGPNEEVHAWSRDLLTSAATSPVWPSAFDIISGRVRCVQDLVWEMLGTVR